jgi:hypothetical protein
MISDSPAYLLLVFDTSERFSVRGSLWTGLVIGRKFRKFRKFRKLREQRI